MSTPSAANTALAEAKMPVQYRFAAAQEMRLAPTFRNRVFDKSCHYIGPKYGGMRIIHKPSYMPVVRGMRKFWARDRRVQCGLAHIGYDPKAQDNSPVTIVVEGMAIAMDRHIIISGSRFFDGAFNGFYMENDLQEIHLDDVSRDSMFKYLDIATMYFFQRLAQEELPTGELYSEWANEPYQQLDYRGGYPEAPILEPIQIHAVIALADRFLNPSLVNFCLQLFLEILSKTNTYWVSAWYGDRDILSSTNQTFLRRYLDAYHALSLGLEFEARYRQIVVESFDFVADACGDDFWEAVKSCLLEDPKNEDFCQAWQDFCPRDRYRSLRLWDMARTDLRTDADTVAEENGDKKYRRNQAMSLIESRNVKYYPRISWGLTNHKLHEIDQRVMELSRIADPLHVRREKERRWSLRKRQE